MSQLILPASYDAARIATLKPDELIELHGIFDEIEKRQTRRLVDSLFPDTGPLRRELYAKHVEFFKAGATKHERAFIAANRVGKTHAAGAEVTYHLTGRYPHWWEGRRWDRPTRWLASGDTHETTRDIIQLKMLGALTDRPENIGTGLIPWEYITSYTPRPHVPGAIERVRVRHVTGGESELWLRSYVQGRAIFQGFELDGFWPDEECPEDVYAEGLVRLLTTHGSSMLTFTPLQGRTPLVNNLMDPNSPAAGDRAVVQCGWDDVPHLDKQAKDALYAKLPPHQRDARTKGIPSLGSGAIYPIPETEITCRPFIIPPFWPRSFGYDVGWNRGAAVWGAINPDTREHFLYAEHYRAFAEPSIHVTAIKAKGDWIPGTIDPASRGRVIKDGEQLLKTYDDLGLPMVPAANSVESGLFATWELLSTGQLKVFSSLGNWFNEYRQYHRDEKGKVVKENDHLMDATRYWVMTGRDLATIDRRVVKEPSWRDKLDRMNGHRSALGT